MLLGRLIRCSEGVFAINHSRFWKAPILKSLEKSYCAIGEVTVCSRSRNVKNIDVPKTNQIIPHNLTAREIVCDHRREAAYRRSPARQTEIQQYDRNTGSPQLILLRRFQ